VVVGDHDEDSLGDEEGWLAVGELFGCAGQGEAELADAVDLGFGGDGHVVFLADCWLPLFQIGRRGRKRIAKGWVAYLREVLALTPFSCCSFLSRRRGWTKARLRTDGTWGDASAHISKVRCGAHPSGAEM
jgi:hypothetical protein